MYIVVAPIQCDLMKSRGRGRKEGNHYGLITGPGGLPANNRAISGERCTCSPKHMGLEVQSYRARADDVRHINL